MRFPRVCKDARTNYNIEFFTILVRGVLDFGYIRSRLFKIEFSKTKSRKAKKFFRLANFSTYMRIYKVVLTFIFIFYSTLFCARVYYYKIQTQTNEKELHIILYGVDAMERNNEIPDRVTIALSRRHIKW